MTETKKEPLYVRQYHEAKANNTGLLLFRMGEFYEAFADDAKTLSEVLGLKLTLRDPQFPMCGFPAKMLDKYLKRLLAQQFNVVVLEQIEETKTSG